MFIFIYKLCRVRGGIMKRLSYKELRRYFLELFILKFYWFIFQLIYYIIHLPYYLFTMYKM